MREDREPAGLERANTGRTDHLVRDSPLQQTASHEGKTENTGRSAYVKKRIALIFF